MEDMKSLWRLAALAFQFMGEVGACVLLGWLLDRWLGTPGRWLAILGISGVVVALVHFVRSAIILYKKL
jgi:F0F1-type ATP synthase assembly protein I